MELWEVIWGDALVSAHIKLAVYIVIVTCGVLERNKTAVWMRAKGFLVQLALFGALVAGVLAGCEALRPYWIRIDPSVTLLNWSYSAIGLLSSGIFRADVLTFLLTLQTVYITCVHSNLPFVLRSFTSRDNSRGNTRARLKT